MNFENIPKLVTKEDPYFFHKSIGILSLWHFEYRYYKLLSKNTMNITTDCDLMCLLIHVLLSASSFQFKIPQSRNYTGPMIYPEFRLHNLLFSYRSILCALFFYYKAPLVFNVLACYLTMVGADIVTHYYKDGTTMRDIQVDSTISEKKQKEIRLFHSKMQICATLFMIGNIDSAFSPLFAIQFSSFLMTLVRKNIIKTNAWHLLYALSLMVNIFVYNSLPLTFILFQQAAFKLFLYLRFHMGQNKYVAWSVIYGLYYLYIQYPYSFVYESYMKKFLVALYFINYLPLFLFPSCESPIFQSNLSFYFRPVSTIKDKDD